MNQYHPDRVSNPADTVLETIEGSPVTPEMQSIVDDIVRGFVITADIAGSLEDLTGVPATFWLARDKQYRDSLS